MAESSSDRSVQSGSPSHTYNKFLQSLQIKRDDNEDFLNQDFPHFFTGSSQIILIQNETGLTLLNFFYRADSFYELKFDKKNIQA